MAQDYFYKNLDYLCKKRGFTREELREKIDMPLLQFRSLKCDKASNQIADYFDVAHEELMSVDLQLPNSYRFLSYDDGRIQFCQEILQNKELMEHWTELSADEPHEFGNVTKVYKYIG